MTKMSNAPVINTQEDDTMAKAKSKRRKASAPTPKQQRASESKVDQVKALCERSQGCRRDDIISALGVTKVAAASLIGDLRRKMNVRREAVEGVSVWKI
jgi:superfamily II DNA helicase RecQ